MKRANSCSPYGTPIKRRFCDDLIYQTNGSLSPVFTKKEVREIYYSKTYDVWFTIPAAPRVFWWTCTNGFWKKVSDVPKKLNITFTRCHMFTEYVDMNNAESYIVFTNFPSICFDGAEYITAHEGYCGRPGSLSFELSDYKYLMYTNTWYLNKNTKKVAAFKNIMDSNGGVKNELKGKFYSDFEAEVEKFALVKNAYKLGDFKLILVQMLNLLYQTILYDSQKSNYAKSKMDEYV